MFLFPVIKRKSSVKNFFQFKIMFEIFIRELENESEDLIGKGDEDEETLGHVFAMWRYDCQRYVIK